MVGLSFDQAENQSENRTNDQQIKPNNIYLPDKSFYGQNNFDG